MADPKLITGKQAIPQIGSDDDGAMHAGIFGYGTYLLQNKSGNFPVVTMQNANTASIPDMCLIVEGRFVRQVAATTVTIQSGSSGMKRNDLVCLKYVKDSDGNETTTWQVFRGSATSGTPADPTIPSGRIIDGVSTSYTAVARVSLNGITPGTPVMLVTNLPPVGDSLTRSIFRFSNIKNGDTVGKVPDPSAVTLIEGTVTLTSGTVAPLPFLHPQYPNRGVGVSIGSDGSIGIWWGSEVNVSKGVVEVRIG